MCCSHSSHQFDACQDYLWNFGFGPPFSSPCLRTTTECVSGEHLSVQRSSGVQTCKVSRFLWPFPLYTLSLKDSSSFSFILSTFSRSFQLLRLCLERLLVLLSTLYGWLKDVTTAHGIIVADIGMLFDHILSVRYLLDICIASASMLSVQSALSRTKTCEVLISTGRYH